METIKFIKGHTYLCGRKFVTASTMTQYEVLNVTELAYQFKYISGATEWQNKNWFHENYIAYEDITNFITSEPELDVKLPSTYRYTLSKPCSHCSGTGIKLTHGSTAGYVLCPICNGSKREVYFEGIENLD